ncbi:DNA-repair protein complementing XP-A cells [Nematocida minor]|uniref:DNA-repair protein complementing XP-A cells n=1 Tax=Nematocida minor TaxID=1912983 RepID=UPI0022203488|nr:DNA-repair protein complementing XP-A cells [Nematocida minor]KAI5191609.1 DNA-repair protein complementing XP-A cells [Nematocida minor]
MEDKNEFIRKKNAALDVNKNDSKNDLITIYDEYSCDVCHGNDVDQSIRRAFKVNYCKNCKGGLELITQTTAISDYLLSKDDLKRMQKMEVINPKNEGWRPMLLYRKEDVEKVSKEKYENIEEEKMNRAKKRKERKQKTLKKKLLLLKGSLRPKLKEEARHSHNFNTEGKCECGMEVEQEEI